MFKWLVIQSLHHIFCETWWRQLDGGSTHGFQHLLIDDVTAAVVGIYFLLRFSKPDWMSHHRMNNDPKQTPKSSQEFSKAKKWNVLQRLSQSSDLHTAEQEFAFLRQNIRKTHKNNSNWSKSRAKDHNVRNPEFGDVHGLQTSSGLQSLHAKNSQ